VVDNIFIRLCRTPYFWFFRAEFSERDLYRVWHVRA